MNLRHLLLLSLLCAGTLQLQAQNKITDGLFVKAGKKWEIIQLRDHRLSLPELEIGKKWNRRWLTSADYSWASERDMDDTYIITRCANLNVFFAPWVNRYNALRAGTGISYRYAYDYYISAEWWRGTDRVEVEYTGTYFEGPGVNFMIEDELTLYKGLTITGRIGNQRYGRDMRSYMVSLKLGYTF